AFDANNVNYDFCRGYAENTQERDDELISQAVAAAKECNVAVVFAGLTDYVESEGCDRENMRLPENQLAVIEALSNSGKKIIVVLFGGSPVELPFANKVNAILNMYLPGQNGGTATYNLLFGEKTPCGKLAETWPQEYTDVPFGEQFSTSANEVYKESVFVGYRYYLSANKRVRYPFGFGLSYTTFNYSDMRVEETENGYVVRCSVTNTGVRNGAEVVQLYVKAPQGVFKPQKELKGFAKVYLKAGESKQTEIALGKEDLRYWNVAENRWVLEGGEYQLQLCSNCETVQLSQSVRLIGDNAAFPYSSQTNELFASADFQNVTAQAFEEMSGLKIPQLPPQKPVTLESRFSDLRTSSLLGKILFKAVLSVAKNDMKKAKKMPDGAEKDNKIKGALFLKRILESNSIITMSMSGGKNFPYNFAQGFVNFANGHLLKGIKNFCTKVDAPKLPKEKEKEKKNER
ncbi:MAG: glycoside hydrolase family 3 C-terminal domain-containing protein, partial [Candidatus Fimimonas sp.]